MSGLFHELCGNFDVGVVLGDMADSGLNPIANPDRILERRTWFLGTCLRRDFSGLGIRNLLDGNGECSGVDGRAASSGDGEGVGSGGGVEGLGTGGPATAAGTSAGDDGGQAGKEADGEKEQLSANEVARPCGGAPNSATAGGEKSE